MKRFYRIKTTALRDHWDKAFCGGVKKGQIYLSAAKMSQADSKKGARFMNTNFGADKFCESVPDRTLKS